MDIENSVAFVTGANRGLGKAFAQALLAAGAAKVYAGARDIAAVTDNRLTPVTLDVTSAADIAQAVKSCPDVTILINNAGAMLMTPMMVDNAASALRHEMDVNVYGLLAMSQAFAPVLTRNGGGAIVNMLSVVSRFVNPFNATYCATKHAALAVSDAMRIELKARGIRVVGVYAGFIDTDMAAGIDAAKVSPQQVAERTMAGLREGKGHILADARAEDIWRATRSDPYGLAARMQQNWDQAHSR